ncbi:MAG: hypothetical protein K1X66_02845 [Verrucomicrobiae bacterium]|nr:hypothetical protein [Verrucomicrobiae bacterium]
MTYHISLKVVAIVLGILIGGGGLLGLLFSEKIRLGAKHFPRNYFWGVVLMVIAMAWTAWLISFVDLGEYSGIRHWMILAVMLLGFATIIFLPDFLTARALGVLLLLGAEVLLSAAFPLEKSSRYVITILAYVWVIAGMIFVALPYRLRDLLFWVCESSIRFRVGAWIRLILGLILVGLGVFAY